MMLHRGRVALVSITILSGAIVPARAQRVNLTVPMTELIARAARDSNDAVAQYEVALGYLLAKRFAEADHSLRLAIELDPGNAAAYLALAYVPFAKNPRLWDIEEVTSKTPPETVKALDDFLRNRRRAFMLDPLVDLRVLSAIVPPQGKVGGGGGDLWNILILGFENFWIGNFQESLRLMTSILNSMPESKRRERMPSFVYWYHGLAAAHVQDYPTAITDFQLLLDRALEREQAELERYYVQDPFRTSNDYRYFLAAIKQRAGAGDQAIQLLQECLEKDLSLYPAHSQLAAIYESRRAWPEAVRERQRALETNPEDPGLLFDLGSTLTRSGDPVLAVDALTRAMETNPRNARIPYLLGQTAMRVGKPDLARSAYERFLALAPSRFGPQIAQIRARLDSLPASH